MKLIIFIIIAIVLIILPAIPACAPTPYIFIDKYEVNSSPINEGQTATIHWKVTGAASVTIDNGIGEVPSLGKIEVKPSRNTVYILTAQNNNQEIQETINLIVNPKLSLPPPSQPIPVLSPLDSVTLLKYIGQEVTVEGKITHIEVVNPHADETEWWVCFFFNDSTTVANFPGTSQNYSHWDFTSFFRIVDDRVIKMLPYFSENVCVQFTPISKYPFGKLCTGTNITITGKLDAYKGAPVMFLDKCQLSIKDSVVNQIIGVP